MRFGDSPAPTVLERASGVCGELVLRQAGQHYEIIENGVFLMDTRNGESERLLVTEAVRRMPPGGPLLVGGLGVGFSLAAALACPQVSRAVVIEREPAVIAWNHGPLAAVHGNALDDPRTEIVEADLLSWIEDAEPRSFHALCLDIDNGPEWTVSDSNAYLYDDSGLAALQRLLVPGGVLAVWSAAASEQLTAQLAGRFERAEVIEVPVARGEPDVVLLGWGNQVG